MTWIFGILTLLGSLFMWEPIDENDKGDLIENHIWLHNHVEAHHVEVIHVENPTISGGPFKK